MKKRIEIIVLIFSILLIIGTSSFLIWKNSFRLLWYSPFGNVVFKMAIISGGPTDYYYLLDNNSVLHYAEGRNLTSDIRSGKFLVSTEYTDKIKLNYHDVENIMSLLNGVEEKGPNEQTSWSINGYNIILLYKDEVYKSSVSSAHGYQNVQLSSFSDRIRGLTPMQLDYSTILF